MRLMTFKIKSPLGAFLFMNMIYEIIVPKAISTTSEQ